MTAMEYKQSLSRRIVIAFVLVTALVAGAFAIGIVNVVHVVEERLITGELGGDLDRLLRMDSVDSWRSQPEPDQFFYYSGGVGEFALPDDVEHLPPGFNEVFRGDISYHVFVRTVDGRKYVLMQDQRGFEAREQVLFAVVLVGFLISLALGGLLGWLLARRVMAPVIRLARQVRHRDQLLVLAPPLAPDYAGDEVGEVAAAFDATLGLLREALTRERLFTSDVSHELRTPLMVLASSCELLLENPGLGERGRAQVLRMSRACEEMRELVHTFLLLARAQPGGPNEGQLATLMDVANDLAGQWRSAIEDKGLRFEYHVDGALPIGYNAPFLRAVLGNLLRNALHYTDNGWICLQLQATGFYVEDSGQGIPEAQREAVFEPFVRGVEQRGDGLGLGLSLVKRICESQGWSVGLSAAESGGCRFQVSLAGNSQQAV